MEQRGQQVVDRIITSLELYEQLENIPSFTRFKSTIPTLDRLIEGFEGGETIMIGGPPKSGKTLLSQSLTVNFLEQGIKSLWFPFEVTGRRFLRCFPEPLPCFYLPEMLRSSNPYWIEDMIRKGVDEHDCKAVFIDHVHYVIDLKSKNFSIEVGEFIRNLHLLAQELDIVIFILCHLKKISFDKEPDEGDYRDSSFFAGETSASFMIWRHSTQKDRSILKICCHRRTGVTREYINLIKVNGMLVEFVEVT